MLVFSMILLLVEILDLFLEDIMNTHRMKQLSSMLRILGSTVLKVRERNLNMTIR